MKARTLKGAIVAAGVVGLLAAGYVYSSEQPKEGEAKVKCYGANSCKGKGECGAPDGSHGCAGKNECKGKGWNKMTATECTEKGGKVLEEKKK